MIEVLCELRAQLAQNRPLGFACWWKVLQSYILKQEVSIGISLLPFIRQEAFPLFTTENAWLLQWEGLVFAYVGVVYHQSGEYILAEDMYRRCDARRLYLGDLQDLHWLDIARDLLTTERHRRHPSRLLKGFFAKVEDAVRTVTPIMVAHKFLDDERWFIRRQALEALSTMGAFRKIADALTHNDLQVRRDAITLLKDAAHSLPASELVARLEDRKEDWFVRWQAVQLLGRAPFSQKVQSVLKEETLWDLNPLIRAAAVETLVQYAGGVEESDILPLLDDPSVDVQIAAITALAQIGTPAAISKLRRMSKSHDLLQRDITQRKQEAINKIQERWNIDLERAN